MRIAGISMTGTPETSRVGMISSARTISATLESASGCMAATTTSSPRSRRRRPSSNSLNDFPTPEVYPRKIFRPTSAFGPFRRLHLPKQCVRVAGRTAVSVSAQRHATILPDTNRAGPSGPGPESSAGTAAGRVSFVRRDLVQGEIEFQDVHVRLAEKTEVASLRMPRDETLNLLDSEWPEPSRPGPPGARRCAG